MCYNFGQLGHLARDFQNLTSICKYCKAFDHVINYCLVLIVKMKEKRNHATTRNVHMIAAKTRIEYPRVNVVTRGGAAIGSNRLNTGKEINGTWVR